MDIKTLQQYRKRGGGIYFLIEEDEISYIGQTKYLYTRVLEHKAEERIIFSEYHCVPLNHLPDDYLIMLEMALICRFSPAYNNIRFDDFNNWYFSLPTTIALDNDKRYETLKKIHTDVAEKVAFFRGLGINPDKDVQISMVEEADNA